MTGLDITWEITLVGLGSLLAGIGSFLAGYAALHRANQEPKPPPKPEEKKPDEWVKVESDETAED